MHNVKDNNNKKKKGNSHQGYTTEEIRNWFLMVTHRTCSVIHALPACSSHSASPCIDAASFKVNYELFRAEESERRGIEMYILFYYFFIIGKLRSRRMKRKS